MKKESTVLKLKKPPFPILECVYVNEQKATIYNLFTSFSVFNDYKGDDKMTIAESYDYFGASECCSGYNYTEPGDYPIQDDFKTFGSIYLDEQNTKDLFTALSFVSSCDLRPVMTGIFIGRDIAATDAHMLYWSRINSYSKRKKNFVEFIIPQDVIKLLKIQKVKTCTIEYDKELKNIRIKDDKFEIISRLIDGKYPNYLAVIPTKDLKNFTVNSKDLLLALKKLSPLSNVYTKRVIVSSKGTKLILNVRDEDRNITQSISLDIKGKLKEPIGFNISLFIKSLSAIKVNDLKVDYVQPNRAILLNNKVLLMPTMI